MNKESMELLLSRFVDTSQVNLNLFPKRINEIKSRLKFSVITPSFNQAAFIEQTISGVLDQKYDNLEYIIIDGASDDGTAEIIKKYENKLTWWVSEKDNGQSDALNKGFKRATGDIIGWINSDDWYEPGVLEIVNRYFSENPAVNVIAGNCNLIDSEGCIFDTVINYSRGFDELKKFWVGRSIPTQPAIFFRRSLLEKYGLLDTSLHYAMDYDLWMRFALTENFHHIDKVFANYRFHKDAKGGDQDWSRFQPEWYKIFNRYVQRGNNPLVSVIIPCYNYGRYLPEAVESVINQTFKDFEIIIVNDGSTDNSKETAEALVLKYQKDYRIRLLDQPNSGQPAIARNNGIAGARGEYILCLDADDKIAPSMLEECFFLLELNPSLGIAYTYRQDFDGADQVIRTEEYNFDVLRSRNFISVCSLFRKKAWQETGGYRTNVRGLEDWDFWIALGARSYYGKLIHKPLFCYRRHDTGLFQEAIRDYKLKFAQIILNNREVYASRDAADAEAYIQQQKREISFSVIIPTYNRISKLLEAVQSVLNQTYTDFEVIVVNDAGEDAEVPLNNLNDKRIKYLAHEVNKGLAAARNTGIKAASGKYIALLDDDDIYYPDHLKTAAENLTDDVKVIYTDAVRAVCENDRIIRKFVPYSIDFDRDKLLIGNIAPVNCFVFEKSLTEQTGLFNESMKVLEDWEFWLRLSSLTPFKHIKKDTCQVNWDSGGSTMTSERAALFGSTRTDIYKKYEPEINRIHNINSIVDEFNAIWRNDSSAGQTEQKPEVSIIALSYNQETYTKLFIDSVISFTSLPYELIIIDNNSSDGSVNLLKEYASRQSNIKVIFNKENIGFPKGINQGIREAAGEFILIANNDIIVTNGWLERLTAAAESDTSIGLAGPISNSVSGVQIDKNASYTTIEEMHSYAAKVRHEHNGKFFTFPRVAFLCTLIKREVIDRIGALDERFTPGNFEDDDFCLRAQLAGYKTIICQDVFIHHFGSVSFKADGNNNYVKRLEINKHRFVEKWGADPEEIWLKGKPVKRVELFIPLSEPSASNIVKSAEYVRSEWG